MLFVRDPHGIGLLTGLSAGTVLLPRHARVGEDGRTDP
jgi:hypothetical protein